MSDKMSNGVEGEEVEEVEELRIQVAQLHQVCVETREELLTHRQVLQKCLELESRVEELLMHRETFKKCIDMEESIQAVADGAQIINELGQRQLEFEQSLAGVSDNTARHGKAIATLSEQQKRTSSTMDAVVRAVKRVARSRSRSYGPADVGSAAGFASLAHEEPLPRSDAYTPAVSQDLPPASEQQTHALVATRSAEGDDMGRTNRSAGLQNEHVESQPRLLDGPLEDWGNLVNEMSSRYGAAAADANWIGAHGWPPLGTNGFDLGALGYYSTGATSEEEPRYSASSSCGSDRAFRKAARSNHVNRTSRSGNRSARSSGASSTRYRNGMRGIPDICLGGPGDLGSSSNQERDLGRTTKPLDDCMPANTGPVASPEMASCVQGVLSRIEEALSKLDSGGSHEAESGGRTSGRSGQKSRNASSHGERRRPQSARGAPRNATPRGARAAAVPWG